MEKREYERHAIDLPVSFTDQRTRVTYRGRIRNIGLGGVLLETAAQLAARDLIALRVSVAGGGTDIGAVVVRYHREGAFGLAFVSLKQEDQELVERLIAGQGRRTDTRNGP